MRHYLQVILVHLNEPLVFPLSSFLFPLSSFLFLPIDTADLILVSHHKTVLKSGLQLVRTFSVKDRYDNPHKYFSWSEIEELRRTAGEFVELNS